MTAVRCVCVWWVWCVSVGEAVAYMEQSKTKCIGITIETRPDYCLKPHLNEMLSYGCTRIEIGTVVTPLYYLPEPGHT